MANCAAGTTANYCPSDCPGGCDDHCWWTTCRDSVQQALTALAWAESNLCVDRDRIWMAGSSNGGMLVYDLANDPRLADRLAGIATELATPHYGYSFGPLATPMSMVSVYGLADIVVPPVADQTHSEYSAAHPDRTFDTSESGWYYTSAEAVGWLLGAMDECAGTEQVDGTAVGGPASLSCTRHTGCPGEVDVVGCFHAGGHVKDSGGRAVMAGFMATHRWVRPRCWGAASLSGCWGVRRYWGMERPDL